MKLRVPNDDEPNVIGAALVALIGTILIVVVAIGLAKLAGADDMEVVAPPAEIAPYIEPCPSGTQYATRNPATGKYRELRCP